MTLPPDLAIQNTESASNIEIHLRPANLRHGIKNAKSDKRMSHIAFCLPHGHTMAYTSMHSDLRIWTHQLFD